MLTYSTRDLPAKAKVSYWNDAVSSVFTPLEARPFDYSAFDADISCLNLGRVALAHVVSGAASIVHQVSHASRSTERKFFIQLHVRGRFAVSQDGKEVELEEGDFTFCDTSLPFTIHLGEATTTLVLSVPAAELKQYLPTPEQAICTKLSGTQGFSSVTSTMLGSLWTHAKEGIDPDMRNRVSNSILDMVATSWLMANGRKASESAVAESRRIQIKRYIEANLRDPELTARSTAAAFGISPRYLHMLFANQDETVCNYILRRRLEQCVKQFSDPLWKKHTITEIAFSWGFNNATHFARVFREHYDTSPRDFRNGCLAAVATMQ